MYLNQKIVQKNYHAYYIFNGGAFSYKASMIHKHYACLYALEANCKVFFPDYHLLPKYPYPTAYEEVSRLISISYASWG